MIHHVEREPRLKMRKMTIRRENVFADVERMSYKLSETAVPDDSMKDRVAADHEDNLDGPMMSSLLNARVMNLEKRLAFCMAKREIFEVNDDISNEPDVVFFFNLPVKFNDNNLKVAAGLVRDYLAKGLLLDWYMKIGSSFGAELPAEVQKIESQIVDIFRVPGFVNHPSLPYHPSFRSR